MKGAKHLHSYKKKRKGSKIFVLGWHGLISNYAPNGNILIWMGTFISIVVMDLFDRNIALPPHLRKIYKLGSNIIISIFQNGSRL